MISRRELLKAASAVSACLAAGPVIGAGEEKTLLPRSGKSNRFLSDGKPLLVVVEGRDGDKMLARGLEALGGLGKIVAAGDHAFLKPNLGSHRDYPTGSDPKTLVAIAGHLREAGAGKITICESSDPYVLNRHNDPMHVFKVHKVFEIAEAAGVEVICTHPTDEKEYVPVACERWEKNPTIRANPHLLSASVLINQPMLKRHGNAFMTCALKNFYGAVWGSQRLNSHRELRENGEQGLEFFMKTVAEFADCMRPELTIVDARKILTVQGPSLKPGSVVKDVHKMIFSGDMVATDAYCAGILDEHDETFERGMIAETLRHAEALGLGTADLSKVKIVEITA